MNHCTNCGAEFEGKTCPNCGKGTVKTARIHAERTKHALRLLHFILLIAFGALVIGLMALNAFGAAVRTTDSEGTVTAHLGSITFFGILTDETAHGDPAFACTVCLLIFAIISVLYGVFLLFTSKSCANLKYTTILFIYLPVFIILCAFSSYVRDSETVTQDGVSVTAFTELGAGGISIFVLSVFFAIAQIAFLVAETHVKNAYADNDAVFPAKPEKPYVIAEYPYPAIPHPKNYSKQELAVWYNETLPQFNEGVDLMKEHRPEYVEVKRAAMKEYRTVMKEYRAERRRLLCALYQKKHNTSCHYPVAYLWWNFSA